MTRAEEDTRTRKRGYYEERDRGQEKSEGGARTEREVVAGVGPAVAVDAHDRLAEVVALADLLVELEVLQRTPARSRSRHH